METPAHVVPEWYFLLFYAILRSIPHKLGGIATMGGSIVVLFLVPFLNTSNVRSATYRPLYNIAYWVFVGTCAILVWVGQCPAEDIYAEIGRIATVYYFLFFLILMPVLGKIESDLALFKVNEKKPS
jgi:ubiquinol-cytochrome c reductase cytochrome b subunit